MSFRLLVLWFASHTENSTIHNLSPRECDEMLILHHGVVTVVRSHLPHIYSHDEKSLI
jgi:hypothetical protein